jgi:FAD/FMN-containing dehydrogenase
LLCLIGMKGLLKDLNSQISGEVTTSESAREYFSTDGSIFTIKPEIIIYPRNEMDVVNTVKFLNWQAQEGKVTGLTARGKGTDQAGGALGSGAVLVFPAHMKALVSMSKEGVTVQPGMIYATLQTVLHSHFQYLPPYPASIDFSSIGGAVANNAGGEKSLKYGSTRHWVNALRVVLSNGDVIITHRLTKKELKKKQRQPDFEGHIYREVDKILTDNWAEIEKSKSNVTKNSCGYDIWDVIGKDGSFDLSQLIVGSQGTLGIVTEATLRTAAYNPNVMLVAGYFDSIHKASEAVQHLLKLDPSALEVVDKNLLEFLQANKPEQIAGLVPTNPLPEVVLLCELDDAKPAVQKKKTKQAMKILEQYATGSRIAIDKQQQDELWRVRRGAAAVIWKVDGPKKALPIIEDGIVPTEKLTEFLNDAYALFAKNKIQVAVWGHAGNGHFHIQPFMDLKNLRDRSKVFDLADDFYALIKKYGGSNSGEHNDGIMRGVYLKEMYGPEIYGIFEQIKNLFDPLRFLNPGVKMDVTRQDAMVKMRKEYSMKHLDDHMPGSYNH